ncbi:MAG: fused MFS/spermidine synthase [Bryobacteraceae bacterium]
MPIYACTILLSAFLLFLIQPLVAKVMLPWFGGSAAVWITCLVFFQTVLLLGYLYAYGLTRWLRPRVQSLAHLVFLGASLAFLPIAPGGGWKPVAGADPSGRILALLAFSIGLPYVLLSSTSPLLQAWYARGTRGSLPYRLFAYSNAASLLALFAYPVLVEPNAATHVQTLWWSAAYVVFAVLCGAVAWRARNSLSNSVENRSGPAPTRRRLALWLLLSACGSMVLLSITNHLTQNIAAVPFLWVLPLSLYLLTFILAFSQRTWISRTLVLRLLAVALGSVGYLLYETGLAHPLQLAMPLFCFVLFTACLFCHSELNRTKPDSSHLTLFYVLVSLGGACGAIFVGLLAPRLFTGMYELPVSLLLTAILVCITTWQDGWSSRLLWVVLAVAMAKGVGTEVRQTRVGSIAMMRSFYGSLRVIQSGSADRQLRTLYHGTITHGSQFLFPPRRLRATTYYGRDTGAAAALLFCCEGPKRVGVIGLGAGSLAAYGRRGDVFRFYEINPQVQRIAQSVFTYLRESRAAIDVVLGDARLSLQEEPPQRFDVLLVDAFSGDAVPVHLLTKEAMGLYLKHLQPGGILAFHVSNSYLNLAPVVGQLADSYGKRSRLLSNKGNADEDETAADWVLVADPAGFARLPGGSEVGKAVKDRPGLRLWTDDYSSLTQVLKTGR